MKKLLSLLILLILFAMVAIVPKKMRESKLVYEQRMVTVVDVIKKTHRSIAVGDQLKIKVYAPEVDLQEDRGMLVVNGIVGLSSAGSSELFDLFAADLRNDCKGFLDSDCLRVDTLTVGGSKLVQVGEVVGRIPSMSFKPADNEARAASIGDSEEASQPAEAGSQSSSTSLTTGDRRNDPVAPGPTDDSEQASQLPQGRSQSGSASLTTSDRRNDPVARGPTGPHHENVRTPDDSSDAGNLVAKIQRALKRLGYRPGLADNMVGKRTFSAIVAYQRRSGLKPNGKASLELLKHIQSIVNIGQDQAN